MLFFTTKLSTFGVLRNNFRYLQMENKHKVIIIDDEADAIEAIEFIINQKGENFQILAATTNPIDGVKLILEKKPDIVFLDVEMPQLSGFKLLEIIGEFDFQLIFVTAYENYAIKAIKHNAIDYILKPVSTTEIYRALEKAETNITKESSSDKNNIRLDIASKKLVIPTISGHEFINTEEIIRFEADSSYSKIHLTSNKTVLVSKTLKELDTIIDNTKFFRTHRSHIINIYEIKRYERGGTRLIMNDESSVPISRANHQQFKNLLNDNFTHIKYE